MFSAPKIEYEDLPICKPTDYTEERTGKGLSLVTLVSNQRKVFLYVILLLNVQNSLSGFSSQILFPFSSPCLSRPICKIQVMEKRLFNLIEGL